MFDSEKNELFEKITINLSIYFSRRLLEFVYSKHTNTGRSHVDHHKGSVEKIAVVLGWVIIGRWIDEKIPMNTFTKPFADGERPVKLANW